MKNQLFKILVPIDGKEAPFEEIEVSMETILRNFEISEANEEHLRTIGKGGERGFENPDAYLEQLKKGKATLFNRYLGTYRPILILPDDELKIKAIKRFCRVNDIEISMSFTKI